MLPVPLRSEPHIESSIDLFIHRTQHFQRSLELTSQEIVMLLILLSLRNRRIEGFAEQFPSANIQNRAMRSNVTIATSDAGDSRVSRKSLLLEFLCDHSHSIQHVPAHVREMRTSARKELGLIVWKILKIQFRSLYSQS